MEQAKDHQMPGACDHFWKLRNTQKLKRWQESKSCQVCSEVLERGKKYAYPHKAPRSYTNGRRKYAYQIERSLPKGLVDHKQGSLAEGFQFLVGILRDSPM